MLSIHPASKPRRTRKNLSIGLAVAGGGPVGAVYELGALRALEEHIEGLDLHKLDVYVGVSAGAFIAAALANRISCTELCRIFMGQPGAAIRFRPGSFLRPAYREYAARATQLPAILGEALLGVLAHPASFSTAELLNVLGKALPSGIFDNEAIHDFLEHSFRSTGRENSFEALDCKLFVVAVDLDNGASVRFGEAGQRQVPISRAVQASAALPGLYPPVKIGDRYYVDGALQRTLHASVALDQGVDLLLGVNPLVPYDAAADPLAPAREGLPRMLSKGGLPMVLSQTFRALIQSRMQVGFSKYHTTHPEADLLLLEPDRSDEKIFFTNIFSYASRAALCEHAYQTTRLELLARSAQLGPLLERYGMHLDLALLNEPQRTLEAGTALSVPSQAPVGRTLARTLEELERLLAANGN